MAGLLFDDAVAVVTGAGSGIGRATAHELHRRGCTVAVLDIDQAAAEVVAKAIEDDGGNAHAWAADVGDADQLRAVLADIEQQLGSPSIVVNNAGVGMSARLQHTTLDDWDWIRSVNLDGVVNGCHILARPLLDAGRGHVVNVASGLAYTPRATEPFYVTTKAAVLALSRCLRSDWQPLGVGVSVICPGVINTPIYERSRLLGDQADDKIQKRTQRIFSRGHDPAKVATAIADAIVKDRGVVPVGWEARLGWALDGLIPQWLERRVARVKLP